MRKTFATCPANRAARRAAVLAGPRGDDWPIRRGWRAGAVLLFAVLLAAGRGLAEEVPADLMGDWYVLIHYRDAASADPEAIQWDEEIWRIAHQGDRVVWTLYPHVTLRDADGRFETLPSGERARSSIAWSPSASQLAEIRGGLELDDHESRSKRLRGSSSTEWRSGDVARSPSASMVAYRETWSIGGLPGARELARRVVLEAARAESAKGRTVFTIRETLDDGQEMTGDYARDGERAGRFRMIRIAAPAGRSK